MLLPYYIILSVLAPSMIFSVSHDGVSVTYVMSMSHFLTCVTAIYNITPLLLPKSKIRREKKLKIDQENRKEIKPK